MFSQHIACFISTETAVAAVHNDMIGALDRGEIGALVLLDMSAAFDTVDHSVLLATMKRRIAVTDDALAWISDFIRDRSQTVHVVGSVSEPTLVSCGVSQGSVLGPRIFCYYTEGVVDIFDRHSPSYHFYADDMAAQFLGKLSDAPRIASAVAELITDVKEWCASMRLQLNTTKTEVMWFGTPYSLRKLPDEMRTIDVGVEKLTTVQDVRYLGVCLDGELSMRTHIASVTRSAFYHLRRLCPVDHLLGRAITAQLVASFVLSRLDYCNVILAGLPDVSIRPLQRVLNTVARVVLGQGPRDSATAALKELHWLPVRARVEYKLVPPHSSSAEWNGPTIHSGASSPSR